MYIKGTLIFFILSIHLCGFSQQEGLVWYFGYGAGLKFINGTPEALTDGSLVTVEGCSTISNSDGYLILYSDGVNVYNRNHQIMQNGSGLMGDPSATQSGVIVPVPDMPKLYYVFTVGNLDVGEPMTGFKYSIVNLNLDGGLGGINQNEKNIDLIGAATERVTAVQHHNKNGVWVIAQEWNTNNFYSYLVTSEGLDFGNIVVSEVGDTTAGNYDNGKGYMKVSSDGKKLAVAIQGSDKIQLFNFVDSTGVVSDLIVDIVDVPDVYGIEFSKNSHFLYATERYGSSVYQWNIYAGSPQEILDSRVLVGEMSTSKGGALQMAPDGKIYIARQGKKYLSVINEPSNEGITCDFQEVGVQLDGKLCQEGLPCFIQSYFNNLLIYSQNYCRFDTVYFSLNDTAFIDSIEWDFGDPASGIYNHSSDLFPYHIYSNPGTYNVHATTYHIDTYSMAHKTIDIFDLAKVDVGSDTTICSGDSIVIYANNDTGYIYKWLDNPSLNKRKLTIKDEGLYWVEGTNLCNTDTDSVYIHVNQLPEVDLGKDTAIKYNSSIILDAGYWNNSYLWQDGSTGQYYSVDSPGSYWVEVADDIGCKSSDTITVAAVPFRIYLPDAFTPNNDGINDVFKPRTTYDVDIDFELIIYNRWGEEVFKTSDIDEGWDGTFNGIKCPEDVYIWYLNAAPYEQNEFLGSPSQRTGNVTLLR